MGGGRGVYVPVKYLGWQNHSWQEKDLMGKSRHILWACNFFICNPEGNKSLERLTGTWQNDIKVHVTEISGLENLDCGRRGSAGLTTRHPSIRKSWH
jgi:hypothetical protein